MKIKRSLHFIPFFFTFSNAILGMLAVIKALNSEFIMAAHCILLAAFMDNLDGRLARALGSTTLLGMELDSLSDAISFCLAPAILLYSWELQDFGITGFLVLAFYLCAGLFRLAKFNTISNQQTNFFLGLPTPIAAFFLTSLVLCHDWISQTKLFHCLLNQYIFFLLMIFISFLMISSIRFPTFKHKFKILLIISTLLIVISFLLGLPWILFGSIFYILGGFTTGCYSGAKRYLTSKF